MSFKFDSESADRAVSFFERYLTHVKGEWAGKPLLLEDWQKEQMIRPLFGWKRKDGTRKYRTCYVEIPRKNGKTLLSAGLALYLLLADGEPGPEIYAAAADREQARLVFDMARGMVENSRDLSARADVFRNAISAKVAGGTFKVISAEAYSKHGFNAHGIIFDEFHAQPNRELFDVLKTSMGARRQPLMFIITTAGFDRESICWKMHDYAVKVRDGIVDDPTFLPVIYGADVEEDFADPNVWAKANPNLGISLKREYLEQESEVAKEVPSYENTFRRLHLNQWTEQHERFLPMDKWDSCDGVVDESELFGKPCFGGLDLASTTDIAALVLLFQTENGIQVVPRFWVPEEGLRRREQRDGASYQEWAKSGSLTPTPGEVIDYDRIRSDINELGRRFDIREIAFDRWGATQLRTQLEGDGFEMVQFGQGFASMSAPSKELLTRVLSGGICHGGNPVLRWMAANTAVKQDAAGNLKPAKDKSSGRIDGIVALIMALDRITAHKDRPASVYESRGVLAI